MDIRDLLDWRNAAPGWGALMSSGWLAEQFASGQTWFSQIPFGWLAIVFFAFWLGYDLYHPQGRLRGALRGYRSFVEFGFTYQRQVTFDRGPDHGGELIHIGIILPVTFKKNVNLDGVRLTGYAYGFAGVLPIKKRAWAVHEWSPDIGRKYLRNDTVDVPIAYIPYDFRHPGYYGDLGSEGYYLAKGTAHVVLVEFISGRHVERKKHLLLLPNDSVYWDGISGNPGGRFLVLEDDSALFPALPHDKANLFRVGKHTRR